MDKSKIRVYEYEFCQGTSASRTVSVTTCETSKLCADDLRDFGLAISVLKINPVKCDRLATKIDNDELKAVVEEDTSQTTCALAERFNVLIPSVLDHLKQIGKINKLGNWVPHELKEHQKTRHLETCCSMLSRQNTEQKKLFLHGKSILFNNCKRSVRWLDKDENPIIHSKTGVPSKEVNVLGLVVLSWCHSLQFHETWCGNNSRCMHQLIE